MSQLQIVGKPTPRFEGPQKVTGSTKFAADIPLPGMLWGKVLRSPFPHARIVRIDTSKAKQLPGVHAVITGREFPYYIGRWKRDLPVLAIEKVRFIGERVVAVAAETPEIAEEALATIDVEYQELPAVFDHMDAIREGAPPVHDNPQSYEGSYLHPDAPKLPNLCSFSRTHYGNIETAFKEATHVFENTFTMPSVHQGYIEPHACAAWVNQDGFADIWASHKSPWLLRNQLAKAFNTPPEKIRVNPVNIGGDFGGKGSPMDTPVAYLLSQESGRPVKLVMSYVEELLAGNPRHPGTISVKTGVEKDGSLCGMQIKAYFNSGAYGAFKPSQKVDIHGIHQAGSCYKLPGLDIQCYMIYTNTVPHGHMRSPGSPQAVFAVESQMDIIANALGLDPAEFRMRNLVEDGYKNPRTQGWQHIRAKETLEKALETSGWSSPKDGLYVGRGVAMYERAPGAFGESAIKITLGKEGNITLLTGVHDPGQGAFTVFQQIASEVLEVPLKEIRIESVATDAFALESGVGGSRTTNVTGHAVHKAAEALKERILQLAAQKLGTSVQNLRWESESISAPSRRISLQEVASWAFQINGQPVEVQVSHQPIMPDITSFCAQVAEVQVDPETGQVKVRRIVTAHDVGTVVNPVGHQGQIEGGVIQGLGYALTEELPIEDGKPTTLHMGDYKIPSIKDVPDLVTVLLEEPYGTGPSKIHSIGESSNVPTAAAIANAVADAIGQPILSLPITAEKVWRVLEDKGQG